MTGPSSSPRSKRAGTPGAHWETELVTTGERWVPDGEPEPTANRAARRAAKRSRKRPVQPAHADPNGAVMPPEPAPLARILHLVDRAERGALLPAEAAQLRTHIRALYAHAYPIKEQAA